MSRIAKAISSILSQFAAGTPIWKISAPAFIHAAKSGLQMTQEQLFSNGNCLLALEQVDSTDDPFDRIGLVLLAIMNIHLDPTTDKPFNPIQGEFIDISTAVVGGSESGNEVLVFRYQVEQIWHHPPVASFRLKGPSFTLEPENGIDGSKGFTPGFNSVEFRFPDTVIQITTKTKGTLSFNQPSIRVDPIFLGKRTVGINDSSFWVKDELSGIAFHGKVTKPHKISGYFVNQGTNEKICAVSGDLFNGVYFTKSPTSSSSPPTTNLWIKGLDRRDLKIQVSESVANDPFYSENVWKHVFKHMATKSFEEADIEKSKVEQRQRQLIQTWKEGPDPFESRFGFKSKYLTLATQKHHVQESDIMTAEDTIVVDPRDAVDTLAINAENVLEDLAFSSGIGR